MSVLQGLRVVEIAGIGPGPFCGMLLADLGADVIAVERPTPSQGQARPSEIVHRGKRSLALDLKHPRARDVVLGLLDNADVLIEGMRPGVMERLGLGPEPCLARRPSLVYGRMTGWGQHGPLAQTAGHDSNYIALSGALWYASPPGEAPVTPPTLVGDIGGALYLALGLLAAVLRARESGRGQVVDAAIVDTSAPRWPKRPFALKAGQGNSQAVAMGKISRGARASAALDIRRTGADPVAQPRKTHTHERIIDSRPLAQRNIDLLPDEVDVHVAEPQVQL